MTSHNSSSHWFLAQLKPNSYRIAERNLARQGFRSFLPMHEETHRVRGKFTTQLRPLFPGYIFVSFDPGQGLWHKVNSTLGIARLVSIGKNPASVPIDLITQLMTRCDLEGKLQPPRILEPGDEVIISKGPFTEFVATVDKLAPDQRVFVFLNLLGRETRLAVDAAQLRMT